MTIFNVCTQRVAVVISGALLTLSFQALGAPAVSSVVINEGEQDRKRQISVFGNGFGSKAQPAPILVDHVDVAYENGVKNNVYADIDGSEVVVRSSDSNESLWEKSSLDMRVDSTRPKRHGASTSHYYFEGENSILGWPNAYGGNSDTPIDNRQLYLSWWYKPKFDPSSYWAFTAESANGDFQESETLLVEGGHEGTYIGIDREGLINAAFPGVSKESLVGSRIEGETSGATVTFPTEFRSGSGTGYQTPGSQKFLRIWEDPMAKRVFVFPGHRCIKPVWVLSTGSPNL